MTAIGTVHRFADKKQLCAAAADAFVAVGADAIEQRGRFVVALSGGSTPRTLYRLLASPDYRGRLDWNRVEFLWGDERTVPPDHEDSNYRMAHEALLRNVDVDPARVHRIKGEREDVDAAANDYAAVIADCFDVHARGPAPRLDLILLGLGEDGHVASLFPHSEALRETDRWVVANHVPKLGTTRITVTFPLINRARAVFFLVAGASKVAALADALHGPHDPDRFPSHGVRPSGGRVAWYVDDAAAPETRVR